jgi:integrase/recombinase XerC
MAVSSFLHYIEFEKRYSSHTLKAYRKDLEQFSQFLKEIYALDNAQEADFNMIRSWIISLNEDQTQAISINRKIATLKSFYKFLLKKGEISQNPTLRLKPLKTPHKSPNFVEEDKLVALLDKFPFNEDFDGWRSKLILEILYGTGIRLSELINLKTSQIDTSQAQLKVLGKRAKERIIPIHTSLMAIILEYEQVKKVFFGSEPMSPYLILTDKGTKSYPSLIYRTVEKYLKFITTQSQKSPHVLRHTFATHLLNKGADLNAIKDLLGHSSLAATQVYTHNSLDRLREVFEQAHPKA